MLRGGKWKNKQVISPEWHKEMLTVWTPAAEMNPDKYRNGQFEYGYMWWLFNSKDPIFKGAYSARGAMGQYITVIPALDMVIAHKTDRVYQRKTSWDSYFKMVNMLIKAKSK